MQQCPPHLLRDAIHKHVTVTTRALFQWQMVLYCGTDTKRISRPPCFALFSSAQRAPMRRPISSYDSSRFAILSFIICLRRFSTCDCMSCAMTAEMFPHKDSKTRLKAYADCDKGPHFVESTSLHCWCAAMQT